MISSSVILRLCLGVLFYPAGVNNVGTVPAALTTYASVQALKPDLRQKVHKLAMFISYRVSLSTTEGILFPFAICIALVCDGCFQLLPIIITSAKAGVLSTGDSFDMCERDQALAEANDATIVDMEGAAIAYVASLLSVPVIFLKVISNSVNGGTPSPEEFQSNLASVTAILGETVGRVVEFIRGKCLVKGRDIRSYL